MAYPPSLPPTTRTDSTVAAGTHASDHNQLAAALRDIIEALGPDPAGSYVDLTNRLLGVAAGQDQAAIDAFNAALAEVVDLSNIETSDDLVSALIESGVLGPKTRAALSASIDAKVPAASTTAQGKVELATTAEIATGTDSVRAVTPAGLKTATDKLVTKAGGEEYWTTTPQLGKVGWFPNTGAAIPVIAEEDYILFQPFAKNSIATPRVWAGNPVVVKAVKSPTATNPLVIGWEISVTNDTDEANDPDPSGSNGAVLGLYISYINTVNQGSAAMYVTGIAAGTNIGWKHGLFLDGIKTGGTGISLRNAVGGNAMGIGIDLSTHTGNFGTAGIMLGNGHRLSARRSDGSSRELIYMNGANVLTIGDAFTQDYTMRFYAQTYEFSGISTAAAASAGTGALPAAPARFWPVTVAGTAYKVPLYNV